MKASLTNHRQAPRKVRVVADTLRGKNVAQALDNLSFMPKKAALPMMKLLKSAVANARQTKSTLTEADLEVASITVDKGRTFVRFMPRAHGRAAPINKESSHVKLTLRERAGANESVEPKAKAKKASSEVVAQKTDSEEMKSARKTVNPRATKRTIE